MFVPLVGDDEVGLGALPKHRLRSGRIRDCHNVHRLTAGEESFDLLLGVGGQADDAGGHRRSGYHGEKTAEKR
jgi:hypothetical protein